MFYMYLFQGCLRMFGIGYSIQAVIKIISSIRYIIKHPKSVISSLTHTNNIEFGAFLASLVGLYRVSRFLHIFQKPFIYKDSMSIQILFICYCDNQLKFV